MNALNIIRNIQGRYDLMVYLCKWDPDYRKDALVTFLAWIGFFYSVVSWNSAWDILAIVLQVGIIAIQFGGDLSILPADYRPTYNGGAYTAENSTHIAYDEESFAMADVLPSEDEALLGFTNPLKGNTLCKESPLASDTLDDVLMTRERLPFAEENTVTNYIYSRHQLRYIAIRVANRLQHTTNGALLAFYDLANTIVGEGSLTVRRASYFDGLLTMEAFRGRIFRGNLKEEREVYTDLTTYFPVVKEGGQIRFRRDFYRYVSGHMGITSVLLTERKRVALLKQGGNKAIGSYQMCLGGSGSVEYADMKRAGNPADFRDLIAYSMARETCEETGMVKMINEARKNTLVTGFFRWIDRSGLPEFVGLTRAGSIPFSRASKIDGDEVVGFEEIPITVEVPEDFIKVMEWVTAQKMPVVLSSLMALRRLVVIAGYNTPVSTPAQKAIYARVEKFLRGEF